MVRPAFAPPPPLKASKDAQDQSVSSQSYLQIHMAIIGLHPSKQLVVVSYVDQDLGITPDCLVQYAEWTRF